MHAYHVEGGGGHPDVLLILNVPHVLGSSTTPTLPLTVATVDELLPMTMTVHKLRPSLGSDLGIAASRIRRHGYDAGLRAALPAGVRYLPVEGARGLTRADMVRNGFVPRVVVPAGDAPVTVGGVPVPVHEAESLPLTRPQFLG